MHDSPIQVRNAGTHQAGRGEDFRFHRDEFWELMYVREGHLECQQEAVRYPMHSGMAILHPPNALHADFALAAYKTFYIWLDLPQDGAAKSWPRIAYDDETRQLDRICGAIVREWSQRYKNDESESDRMLFLLGEQLNIVIARSAQASEQSVGEQVLLAAEHIMETEYHLSLTVSGIAERLGVSESSLYGYFAALRGQPPAAVLQAIRLQHALGHLRHSTRTLETIASLCGYYSASHLSRQVKAATGSTPGKLRSRTTE